MVANNSHLPYTKLQTYIQHINRKSYRSKLLALLQIEIWSQYSNVVADWGICCYDWMLSAVQYGKSWGALYRESQSAVSEVNQLSMGLLFHLVIVLYYICCVEFLISALVWMTWWRMLTCWVCLLTFSCPMGSYVQVVVQVSTRV